MGDLPYEINFLGWGDADSGDVVTEDGEYLGRWDLHDDVFVSFTPDGRDDHIFYGPHLGLVIDKVRDWHRKEGQD